MRLMSQLMAAAGMVAALAAPVALSTPAQAQHRGGFGGFHGGGFHGGGFHGGGFRGGGFHRGGGFFPGFGIGLGLGVLGAGAYWGYPYYAAPPAYYPPAYPYPYPYSYPPSYPYGPYGAAAAGAQYASYSVPQEQRTVVREVVREPVVRVIREPYPVYVQRRHHHRMVMHKRFCNCGPHWKQPKPAAPAPQQSS